MEILAISATQASLDFLAKGGPFVYPLILCSIAGLTAICFKALSLTRARIIPERLAARMDTIATSDPEATLSEIRTGSSTLARLGTIAVKHRGKPPEEITRAVEATAREEIVRMHSGIGVLDVVITVAPLLGLLGTASGLVTIFQGLGETTDHLAIARGIAQALNTTILGLAIAVPCVVAHSHFTRRIERLTARMEIIMTDFVTACSRQTQGNL